MKKCVWNGLKNSCELYTHTRIKSLFPVNNNTHTHKRTHTILYWMNTNTMSTSNTEEQPAYRKGDAKDHDEGNQNYSNKISSEKRKRERAAESDKESNEESDENSEEESDEESELNSADETFQCPDCDEHYVGEPICGCAYDRYVEEHGEEDSDEDSNKEVEAEIVDEVGKCPKCENTYVGEPDCDCAIEEYRSEKAEEKRMWKKANKEYRRDQVHKHPNPPGVVYRRDKHGNKVYYAKRTHNP